MAKLSWIVLFAARLTLNVEAFPGVALPRRGDVAGLQSTVSEVEEPRDVELSSCEEANTLKKELFQLGASYDRGFGASPSARDDVMDVIEKLEKLNPSTNAARGIGGDEPSPLDGSWRMIWTSAQDVLVLGASPVATVGAIYQVFTPPVITNIIDFIPKAQALVPPIVPSLLRAEVTTRGSPREGQPMRVGLNFESVKLKPVEFLGIKIPDSLPPFGFDLPQIPGADSESSPGYFDVSYLDDELLIIRQNAPGGLFALVKTEDYNP